MTVTQIGIIGCGNISDAYFKGAANSQLIQVKACADLRPEAAKAKAELYGVQALSVEALLADPEIEIVVNLTVPAAHAPVSMQILNAGKHVYLEKPLSAQLAAAREVIALANTKGLRVGCAPDTFFGASHQAARRAIDEGRIGRAVGGTVAVLSHGMEHWHPNPEFFFKRGGGPILDLGPYYITQLVNMLGPVTRVSGITTIGNPVRVVTSEPLKGTKIEVEVPTTVNGLLEFANGANLTLSASWDVWRHQRAPIEVYGTEGSLLVPDPNFFGGTPMISERDGEWKALDISAHPFGISNRTKGNGDPVADYRIVGVLDMATAIRQGRAHRASGKLALHVLEVLEAFERSSNEGRHIVIESPCDRPDAVPLGAGEEVFGAARELA
ncbi:Gfo/Idh/MocA family protein [Pararobbsia silviterrae]|uniref:Gfo/Idh/MocA family oxidoreductase n=1 Tax=Pararobbsia silviterrae TaxID=1792498 RepID=A0A494XRY7_9BURK|nr:Gfo/Idh/MocA family oxidoreductase [Pararobbsia silviterrae]RKP53398.1 gfo/Idh/MocA family oxidoreductase [Pararobbsia silviterrae]